MKQFWICGLGLLFLGLTLMTGWPEVQEEFL